MSYDGWKTSGPHEDLPSHESSQCDRCSAEWAWISDDGEHLCETHATLFLRDRLAKAGIAHVALDDTLSELPEAS